MTKVFYWSPFLGWVATISAVKRSAESITKYSKNKYNIKIIDSIGEWDEFYKNEKNNLFIKLYNQSFFDKLPKGGFLKSRISYLIIFFYSFFKLLKIVNKEKPDYLIIHLITSLPIFLSIFFNKNTKLILRISGYPNLHFLRLIFWKIFSSKIYKVTCPTLFTFNMIKNLDIFDDDKVILLRDPVVDMENIKDKREEKLEINNINKNNTIVSIGRLTKQKNFLFIINGFKKILTKYPYYKLIILGEGEQKDLILKEIERLNLKENIFCLGFKKNINNYLFNSSIFLSASYYEDPGFALLEACLNNTTILSANTSGGPEEFLKHNKNSFIFQNNNIEDFMSKFEQLLNCSEQQLKKIKLNAKKIVLDYSKFRHFNQLKKILN
jgi:glycosyltransferase involved in cell wall biosynthesis